MKFILLSVLAGLFFGMSAMATPSNSDEENLSRLLKARSSVQLAHHLEMQHAIAHDSLVCDAELRTDKLPIACFRVLAAKKDEPSGEVHSFEWLLQLCKERAAKSKNWKELDSADHQAQLPEACRSISRERAADLRYADETDHPAELFDRLLQPDSSATVRGTRK